MAEENTKISENKNDMIELEENFVRKEQNKSFLINNILLIGFLFLSIGIQLLGPNINLNEDIIQIIIFSVESVICLKGILSLNYLNVNLNENIITICVSGFNKAMAYNAIFREFIPMTLMILTFYVDDIFAISLFTIQIGITMVFEVIQILRKKRTIQWLKSSLLLVIDDENNELQSRCIIDGILKEEKDQIYEISYTLEDAPTFHDQPIKTIRLEDDNMIFTQNKKEICYICEWGTYLIMLVNHITGTFDPQTQILTCKPKPDLQAVEA